MPSSEKLAPKEESDLDLYIEEKIEKPFSPYLISFLACLVLNDLPLPRKYIDSKKLVLPEPLSPKNKFTLGSRSKETSPRHLKFLIRICCRDKL
tara:strand:+ start:58 stop:339 length:282 start_codon:yes stop_codon:yes gene_type:complete